MTLCKYALIVHELALDCPARADGTRPPVTFGYLRGIALDLGVNLFDVTTIAVSAGITIMTNT